MQALWVGADHGGQMHNFLSFRRSCYHAVMTDFILMEAGYVRCLSHASLRR